MTVIQENVTSIAGIDNTTPFTFAAPVIRDNDGDTAFVTTAPTRLLPVGGVLTTPNLDPGPAVVRIGLRAYLIDIPDSSTPIRLWPLVLAGLPVPPAEEAAAVRNGGGVALIRVLTEAQYSALTSRDPETLYVVVPNP